MTRQIESRRENCKINLLINLKFSESPFVLTSSVKKSFEMALVTVTQRWPVLLYNPAGSGTTALINRLAVISGNQGFLNGFWVVMEEIYKAPNEVQSLMPPLLEGSSSFATGFGEVIGVAESFCMFATVSTSKHEICHNIEGRFSCSALWRKVAFGTASTAFSWL